MSPLESSIDTRMSAFIRHGTRFVICVLPLLLMDGCTDNPFESTPTIASSQRKVHGVVQLSDTQDHSGVYVWLQGFDIAATTDRDGSFTITLPSPEAQGVAGGANGVYALYAFLGNYRLVSVRTAVRDGAFVFPSNEINENGEIHEQLFMQQLFSITTSLSRTQIEADSPRTITVQVALQFASPPAEVYFPRMLAGIEGPVLLHNTQTGEVDIYPTVVTGVEIQDYVQVGSVPYIRSLLLIIPKYRLKAGIYEIIPYLIPQEQQIPLPLLRSLGDDVSGLNESYVFYPFRREGGMLTVLPN
jgi:hypothetical protein